MHASAFDRYRHADSPVHRLDPRVKVVAAAAFIASTVVLPDGAWWAFAVALALLSATAVMADLPVAFALRRALIAVPFLLAAVTIAFTLPGRPVISLPLGPWQLVATDAGLARLAGIVCRSLLSVQAAILLSATTPFPDIIHALGHLRVPAALVAVLSFMYRYLFVLSDEAVRLLRARDARAAAPPGRRGGRSIAWRARVAGGIVGQLFLRSYERGGRVYDAMLSRGYRGYLYTLHPHAMTRGDWLAMLAALGAAVLVQVAGRS